MVEECMEILPLLGIPSSEHRGKTVRLVLTGLMWLPFLLAGILMVLSPLLVWFLARDSFSWLVFIWVFVGLLIGLGAYSFISENVRNLGRRVLVFPGCIADLRGSRVRKLEWDKVEKLWQKAKRNALGHLSQEYRVQSREDSEPFVFSHRLTDIDTLKDCIFSETYQRLFPKALEMLESGGEVEFGGGLKANRSGISCGDKHVPWETVKSVGVNPLGFFVVAEKGRMLSNVKARVEIAFNLHVLAGLVESYCVPDAAV